MSNCTNCCKCFLQADGSIVKRADRAGSTSGFVFTLTDGTMSETAPASFISTTEISCSKFDQASNPPNTIAVLEEVDADGKQTGVLVQVVENPDGSKDYTNLSDGSAYTAPAGSTLHTSEDTDYNEQTVVMCDEGTDVVRTVIYVDGDITDVVSTTITTLDGTTHTLSGNEIAGSCSNQISIDQEQACFKESGNVDAVVVQGYVKYSYNSTTAATTTTWHQNVDDAELVKANFIMVECC